MINAHVLSETDMKRILDEELAYEILSVVEEVPEGRVATYGQIARLIGRRKNSRLVGLVLRRRLSLSSDRQSLRQAGSRLGRTKTSAARRRSVFQKRRSCRFGSVPVGDLGGNLFCRENAVCMSGI